MCNLSKYSTIITKIASGVETYEKMHKKTKQNKFYSMSIHSKRFLKFYC